MPDLTLDHLVHHNNARFLRQTGRLRLYLADAATVVADIAGQLRQICLLGFMTDGSIIVYWPYLQVQQGVLDAIEFPAPNRDGSVTVKLGERRHFTSQKVKYSHHSSGEAHFNLSGKEPVVVRRPAFPLTGPIGRVFEISVFYPLAFKGLLTLKNKRLYLPFRIPDPDVAALRVRAEWRRKADIIASVRGKGNVGPLAPYVHRSGERGQMFFFGPPISCPIKDHLLCVIGDVVPLPQGVSETGVIFMGGYDLHEVLASRDPDEAKVRGALVAIYPFRPKGAERTWIAALVGTFHVLPPRWRRLASWGRALVDHVRGWLPAVRGR